MAGPTGTRPTIRGIRRGGAERLGDRVRSFATHNEPWVTATIGHELGIFAPGPKRSSRGHAGLGITVC